MPKCIICNSNNNIIWGSGICCQCVILKQKFQRYVSRLLIANVKNPVTYTFEEMYQLMVYFKLTHTDLYDRFMEYWKENK